MPDLPETNAGKSHQQELISVARRDNLSILQTARYWAEGTYMKLVGAPATIADNMQQWLEGDACDGFLVVAPYFPGGVESFVHLSYRSCSAEVFFAENIQADICGTISALPVTTNAGTGRPFWRGLPQQSGAWPS